MRQYHSRLRRTGSRSRSRSCRPCVEYVEGRTLLSAVLWTGTAGDNNWDTPANWNTDSVPGSADDVTINTSANVVHSAGVTDTINSLTSSEPLSITGGTLSIASASSTTSTLTINGGTLNDAGGLTVGGLLALDTGTLSGSGVVTAKGGIASSVNGGFLIDGSTLDNVAGQTATWIGGDVTLADGAVINNFGTVLIQAGGGIGQGAGAASTFNNDGTITAAAGTGSFIISVPVKTAGGTVDIKSGTFGLFGGGTSTGGTFTAESGTEFDLGAPSGGTWALDSGSSIGGAGTVNFEGAGTITMAGTYDVTGTTSSDVTPNALDGFSGTVNFDGLVDSIGSVSLTGEAGTLINFNTALPGTIGNVDVATGALNLGANDLTAATLYIGGTLSGTGTITVSGLSTFNGGTISGSCTVNADGGTSVIGGASVNGITLDGCTFNNPAGQTVTTYQRVVFNDGAVLNNLGTFEAASDQMFFDQGSSNASSFNNEGTFIADASDVEFYDDMAGVRVAFNNVNGGTVSVKQGTLVLAGGGASTGGSFTIESGATLQIGEVLYPYDGYTFDAGTTLSGAGSLVFYGGGVIAGNSTLTGPTDIEDGLVQVDGSQPSSAVGVQLSGGLSGTGTVGAITAHGMISPGDSATVTGVLTAEGSVTLHPGSTFSFAINGATAGTGYSQLDATGSVNLGGSTLTGSFGFTPAAGETFTIIKSTAPIVGTFYGLPEGASVTRGGVAFTISYAGGSSGDDVVLTSGAAKTISTTTSLSSSANPSIAGQSVTFTAVVAPTGVTTATPTGTVIFTIDGKAGSPVPLTEVNGKDQATFTMPNLAAGRYTITASYGGDVNFAPSDSSTVMQVVDPSVTAPPPVAPTGGDGPTVVSVLRYGYHMMPTTVVLTFDQALDAITAQDNENYRIIGPAGRLIGIKSAVYDPAALTVTLHPRQRINIHHAYKLFVDGTAPKGLTNTRGQLLDGVGDGRPDSDYRTSLTWRNLVIDPPWPKSPRGPKSATGNPKLR